MIKTAYYLNFITDKQKIPINIKPAYPKPFGQRQGRQKGAT